MWSRFCWMLKDKKVEKSTEKYSRNFHSCLSLCIFLCCGRCWMNFFHFLYISFFRAIILIFLLNLLGRRLCYCWIACHSMFSIDTYTVRYALRRILPSHCSITAENRFMWVVPTVMQYCILRYFWYHMNMMVIYNYTSPLKVQR